MHRALVAALALAGALGFASQASAVSFTITGTVTSGSGSDGVIQVGDTITLNASAPDYAVLFLNNAGLEGLGLYGGRPFPASLDVTLDSFSWTARDDEYDGDDVSVCGASSITAPLCEAGPVVLFHGSQVLDLNTVGPLLPTFSAIPELEILSGGRFAIFNTDLYGNYSALQSFSGQFDFRNAIVTGGPAVPEPATWMMMLTGFGGLGVALRLRRLGKTHSKSNPGARACVRPPCSHLSPHPPH